MTRLRWTWAIAFAVPSVAWGADQYFPGEGEFGTILVEDLWPAGGDHDFNDAVVHYHYAFELDGTDLTALALTLDVQALGADLSGGFALRLPGVSPAGVSAVRLLGTPGDPGVPAGGPLPVALEAGESDVVIRISDDLRAETLPGSPAGFLNTDVANPVVEGVPVKIVLTFATPLGPCDAGVPGDCGPDELDLARAPFDLFAFRTGAFGHQVHGSRFSGTDQMDVGLFGGGRDGSDVPGCATGAAGARCFVDENGLPALLVIGEGVTDGFAETTWYPRERAHISLGMPDITAFAASEGATNSRFYATHLDTAYLFTQGAGAQPPPSGDLLAYCGDGVVDAGETCDEGVQNGVGLCTATCTSAFRSRLALGETHSCLVEDDGAVTCWGSNVDGRRTVPAGIAPVVDIAATSYNTCVLDVAGAITCWGSSGQGVNAVPSGLGNVVDIDAGIYVVCALNDAGTAKCWGMNGDGQATVPAGLTVLETAPAYTHSCARVAPDSVTCWGRNYDYGQATVPAGLGSTVAIDGGGDHTCVIRSDDTVTCWGRNNAGQRDVPSGLGPIAAIDLGYQSSCALTQAGTVACWGSNSHGQATVPSGLSGVVEISIHNYHTCALGQDGGVTCWGLDSSGQSTPP